MPQNDPKYKVISISDPVSTSLCLVPQGLLPPLQLTLGVSFIQTFNMTYFYVIARLPSSRSLSLAHLLTLSLSLTHSHPLPLSHSLALYVPLLTVFKKALNISRPSAATTAHISASVCHSSELSHWLTF